MTPRPPPPVTLARVPTNDPTVTILRVNGGTNHDVEITIAADCFTPPGTWVAVSVSGDGDGACVVLDRAAWEQVKAAVDAAFVERP